MEETKCYAQYNAASVLEEVNQLIAEYENKKAEIDSRRYSYWETKPRMKGYKTDDVYKRLSIFDWWVETISYSHLLKMRAFLREAIKLGFRGYVCFKVGASGCANGMWAHTAESTDGYSPNNCDILYHSFTPDYSCWDFCKDGKWATTHETWDKIKTAKQMEKLYFGF